MLSADDHQRLLETILRLVASRTNDDVHRVLRDDVRPLTGADGVSIVVREGDSVRYIDENAIGPLWKGQGFPVERCISGWVMQHGEIAVIRDIEKDGRIPLEAYRPTFVRSLVMTPVARVDGVARGAFGAYWRRVDGPGDREVAIVRALGKAADAAFANLAALTGAKAEARERELLHAAAAHELRNAVHAIALRLSSARRMGAPSEQSLTKLETLVDHTVRLLENLLDVARIDAGRLELTYERSDAAAVVKAAAGRLAEEANAAGTAVTVRGASSALGEWDTFRLDQIVTNLVANGIRHRLGTPVTVDVDVDEQKVRLAISDGGPGLSQDGVARLFEPFAAGPSRRGRRGIGLGLWIVKKLIEAHRGTIDVEARSGRGTTIRVELPRWLSELPVERL